MRIVTVLIIVFLLSCYSRKPYRVKYIGKSSKHYVPYTLDSTDCIYAGRVDTSKSLESQLIKINKQ
jgi:hypothetical protein